MSANETKNELAAVGEVKNGQDLQELPKAVIEYLSKEIQTATTNMMVHRSRIAFAVFLGPFLLLIAVVANAKNLNISPNIGRSAIISGIGWCGCFLILAYMNARIEQQAWRQCNRWRDAIVEIYNDPLEKIRADAFRDDLYNEKYRTQGKYVVTYLVLLISFILSIVILFSLREPPAAQPRANTSGPAQVENPTK